VPPVKQKLHGLHRDLLNANPAVDTFQTLAHCCGYWHMGQSAWDYQHVFGELPYYFLMAVVAFFVTTPTAAAVPAFLAAFFFTELPAFMLPSFLPGF
jgi:hypothetical protein